MNTLKEKITLFLSGLIYLIFNLRIASTLSESITATLWQIAQTLPFAVGITWIIVAFLQYMASGKKMPWDRKLRLFFAVGIMMGLFYAIYEYAGVTTTAGG